MDDFLLNLAGLLCHRMPDRSFEAGAVQSLFCARCSGLYIGFGAVFALAASLADPEEAWRRWALPAALSVVLPAADVVLAMLGAYPGWLAVRYATGLAAGAGLGLLFSAPFLSSFPGGRPEGLRGRPAAAARAWFVLSVGAAAAPLASHAAAIWFFSAVSIAGLWAAGAALVHIVLWRVLRLAGLALPWPAVLAASVLAAPGAVLLAAALSGKARNLAGLLKF